MRPIGRVRWSALAPPPWARSIGYVFQDARLFPHLDVRGNLDFARQRARTETPSIADVAGALIGNWQHFLNNVGYVAFAVALHNALGLVLGYGSGRALGCQPVDRGAIGEWS